MSLSQLMLQTTFWACAVLVAYAYIGYPAAIWLLSGVLGRRRVAVDCAESDLPNVSLLIAAHDEEDVIEERLRNALATDYPPDRFEVLVGSDGSTDGTAAAVRGCGDPRVRLLDFERRRGKAAVLNSLFSASRGEIAVLSDANTEIDPGAVRKLVRWFRDPEVGAVCGRLILVDSRTGRNSDGLYWKYETFLKRREALLGALLGSNGAIYAIRRALYAPLPQATLVDDFVIPLLARLRTGCALIYEAEATAREQTPPDLGIEFSRRSRIGAGGYQSIGLLWKLLDPRRGWVAFTLLSHKILRWLCPFFLIGLLASNLLLGTSPFFRACLFAQVGFYLLSLAVAFLPPGFPLARLLRVASMFTAMNAALLVGFWLWLGGTCQGTWIRTARAADPGGVVT
jgi:cellulose synthase/poly-beta-1,6-N-acetylglucosamine synthase-like glycosyltransferase